MVVLGEISITFVIWFSFVVAATFSWVVAYLHDIEDRSCFATFGRHSLSGCVGLLFCWWVVGDYTPPFFNHSYVAIALITYAISSWGMIYQLARFGLFLQSSRVAALRTPSGEKITVPTYENEWVCFVAVQTVLLVLWSLSKWITS